MILCCLPRMLKKYNNFATADKDPAEKRGALRLRWFNIALVGILFVALLIRIAALFNFYGSVYSDFLIWDEGVYHDWAINILKGTSPTYSAHDFAPFPAYLMAFFYKLYPDQLVFRIFNILISTLTCYIIYGIGRALSGRYVGLIACIFSAFYGPFIFFSFTLLKTPLAAFLFSLVVLSFLVNLKRITGFRTLWIGVAIGLLLNVRPNMIFVLIFLPFFTMWHWRRHIDAKKNIILLLFYVVGVSISVGPFVAMKYKTTGEFSLTATGGFNLYLANNIDNPYPYYRPVSFAVSVPSKQSTQFIVEASRRVGKKLSAKQASDFFVREVLKTAREKPVQFTQKLFLKCMALFNGFESSDNYHIGFMSNYLRLFKLPFFAFWAILPLGMIGFVAGNGAIDGRRAMAGVFIMYAATLVIFFTNIRIRMPLLVILIPMAAYGLQTIYVSFKARQSRKLISYAIIGTVFLAVAFIPIPGTDDLSGHYNTHAINLNRKGKTREAVLFWEESSKMNLSYSVYANLSLAKYYFKLGEMDVAMTYVEKIPNDSFAAAQKFQMMGNICKSREMNQQAIAAYEKSLSINSATFGPYRNLADLYKKEDLKNANEILAKLVYVNSFY